jgi:hypothetical protein
VTTDKSHPLRRAVALAAAALAAACGGKTGAAPRHVSISAIATQLAEDGTTTGDSPLPLTFPSIQLDDGSTPPVTAVAPGRWSADVPSGPYWFVAGDVRYRASGDTLDLGYVTTARAQAAPPANSTPAALTLSGLQQWIAGQDTIQLFSWGANSWDAFDPKLTAGLTSATVNENWNTPAYGHGALNLLTPTDTLYAIQYRKSHDAGNGIDYQHVAAVASASGMSMTNGLPFSATLSAMSVPAQAATLSLSWRTSQFEAATPQFSYRFGHQLAIFAEVMQPGGERPLAASPNLLDFTPPMNASGTTPDLTLSSLVYGRFLPAQYREILYSGWVGGVSRVTSSSASNSYAFMYVVRYDSVDAIPSPLVPLVSSVRTVQISGRDATVVQSGVGLRPIISWTAPAVGTPSRYVVKLYSLPPAGGDWQVVSTLNLPGSTTSVQLPTGLQQSGRVYYLWISAQAGTSTDAAPLRSGLPAGAASYATEVYSP